MIKGTTPTHTFKIPFDTALVDKVRIIYAQCDEIVFIKSKEDCQLSGDTITTKLTEADTFKFTDCDSVQIQMRIVTVGGDSLISPIKQVGISKCLDGELLCS